MSRLRLWLATFALAACTRAAPAADSSAARADAPAARDSTWVAVRGPTIVAFWPANAQAVLDSGGDGATALDDFGYHLTSADSGLRALGFRVVSLAGPTFHLVTSGRATLFTAPVDSGDIGFYVVAPERAPTVYYGVHTDSDLLEVGRRYLQTGPGPP